MSSIKIAEEKGFVAMDENCIEFRSINGAVWRSINTRHRKYDWVSIQSMMLGVTGKRNAKRSSIPYLDGVCGLMWVGLPGSECPDWLFERGKEAWLQNLRFSCIRFRR
ncbi:hypothetical protein TNCV_2893581 [Trichonephila clavipes]|nr:hypothetical protein TNCV_2893581 [Trichonephila clavipes]